MISSALILEDIAGASCRAGGCGGFGAGCGRTCRSPGRRPGRPSRRAGPGRPGRPGRAVCFSMPASVCVSAWLLVVGQLDGGRHLDANAAGPLVEQIRGTPRRSPRSRSSRLFLARTPRRPRTKSEARPRRAAARTAFLAFLPTAGLTGTPRPRGPCRGRRETNAASSSPVVVDRALLLGGGEQRLGVHPREPRAGVEPASRTVSWSFSEEAIVPDLCERGRLTRFDRGGRDARASRTRYALLARALQFGDRLVEQPAVVLGRHLPAERLLGHQRRELHRLLVDLLAGSRPSRPAISRLARSRSAALSLARPRARRLGGRRRRGGPRRAWP